MLSNEKKMGTYNMIDYMKLFCSFLVIGIHTRPFLSISYWADRIYNFDIT